MSQVISGIYRRLQLRDLVLCILYYGRQSLSSQNRNAVIFNSKKRGHKGPPSSEGRIKLRSAECGVATRIAKANRGLDSLGPGCFTCGRCVASSGLVLCNCCSGVVAQDQDPLRELLLGLAEQGCRQVKCAGQWGELCRCRECVLLDRAFCGREEVEP